MEKKQSESIRNKRRPKGIVSELTINLLHVKNPLVTAFWSVMFPGLGFLIMGSYVKGFLLIIGATIANSMAHINEAIIYGLTGQTALVKQVLDTRWLLFYAPLQLFATWSSYQLTVDLNKYALLAAREDSTIVPFKIGSWDIGFIDKRNPWAAAAWSLLMPGLGHLYSHRIPTSFYLLTWWIGMSYMSQLLPAIHHTFLGNFSEAIAAIRPGWFLYLVAIYPFSAYDAYVNTVHYNILYDEEQSRFLIDNYQNPKFPMPEMDSRN
ncbi:hypothetical protein [Anaerospora sp.]|jgi:hypothetical protein|uniref:hypothetical protein n=1 Tax=Anaerospora sp. TaxID=1960278 RepID=UPI0028A06EFA|nr:hypothetical protein [Anaerospora sp.]